MSTDIPLCVDLDGTLVNTDTLIESFAKNFTDDPIRTLLSTRHLKQGKAQFKHHVARNVQLDASTLPYNADVVDFIRREKPSRKIVLVTGANVQIAQKVSSHLGLFDEIYASDEHTNLTRQNKQALLETKFGNAGFDYIGNDTDDLAVWPSARKAMVVSSEGAFLNQVREQFKPHKEFITNKASVRDWLKFIRIHQWSKNLLIFVPFLLDHRFSQSIDLFTSTVAFLAFSLLASATYIVNDFLDIESDRKNSTKSKRALASSTIGILPALGVAALLLAISILLSAFLPGRFGLVLASYFLLTMLYSFYLKSMLMIDVCALAALHTVRIIAGTVVIQAAWSFWLLAFSMFFFLSLAIAKRVSELENIKAENKMNPSSRDYKVSDIDILISAGISSGFISVLVISLYVNSDKVKQAYEIPEVLWLICPLLLYWVGRLWILTSRGQMHEDPIVFALTDRISLAVLLLIGIIFLTAVILA